MGFIIAPLIVHTGFCFGAFVFEVRVCIIDHMDLGLFVSFSVIHFFLALRRCDFSNLLKTCLTSELSIWHSTVS